jgi:O6-methylguanine-DNA--protein-cysteine methyltransferase
MNQTNTADLFYVLRATPFGPVAVMRSIHQGRPRISRGLLSKPGGPADLPMATSYPYAVPASCAEIDAVAEQIVTFIAGEDIRFSLDIARLDLCSDFQRRVLRAEHGIPRGKISTYARMARYLGNVKAALGRGSCFGQQPLSFDYFMSPRHSIR